MSSQGKLFRTQETPVALQTATSTPPEKIAIAGLETLLNPEIVYWRRLVWAVILLTCSMLTFFQTLERVERYLSYPIKSHVSYVRYNSLPFPIITICPDRGGLNNDVNHVDAEKVRKVWLENFPDRESPGGEIKSSTLMMYYDLAEVYDVHTLWTKTALSYHELMQNCYINRGDDCTEVGAFQLLHTLSGVCYSYKGPNISLAGVYHGLYLKFCPAPNFTLPQLLVHVHYSNENESLAMKALEGLHFQYGWNKDIAINLREFRSQERPTKSCNTESRFTLRKCRMLCFYDNFIKHLGCRMSYMPYMPNHPVPYCKSSLLLKQAEALQQTWIWEGQLNYSVSKCPCERTACDEKFVSLTTDVSQRLSGKECARIKLYFSGISVEETQEEFAYGIISLLCDIGGTLGLLLGASVLTFVQICDKILLKISRLFYPKL